MSLVAIPVQDWPELRDMFLINWPEHLLGHSIVNNSIEYRKKSEGKVTNLKLFSLNGDWRIDGTFIVIDESEIFLYSLVTDSEEVSSLESALRLVDWSEGKRISDFSSKHRKSVVRVIDSFELRRPFDLDLIFFNLSKEEALELPMNVPNGIILKQIKETDIPFADSYFYEKDCLPPNYMDRQRRFFPNVAAYKRFPDGSEEIMGWCIQYLQGVLGSLYVLEQFQGQGLGKLITTKMCKLLAEQGKDSFAGVVPSNTTSRKMFERLQFKQIGMLHTLSVAPRELKSGL